MHLYAHSLNEYEFISRTTNEKLGGTGEKFIKHPQWNR
jgi:hypothetical protein